VGRTDLLKTNASNLACKAKGINLSKILYKPKVAKTIVTHCQIKQEHGINDVLDLKLIGLAHEALEKQHPLRQELNINNTDRATGAMLSGRVCKIYGEEGLPEDTIHFKFKGVAGQSFGAWLAKGITFELEGMTNDYVGKGISGGKIIIYPDKRADYDPAKNIIIGNTTFYGAINGEAYIRGVAGERFCIRNSGLYAVIEGVGDHGCEYMTGGRVVVLGETGRNFAAGMSGGLAYVYDQNGTFKNKCNTDMVQLEELTGDEAETIRLLLNNHYRYTQSLIAKRVLDDFSNEMRKFIRVVPLEYKRILQENGIEKKLDLAEVSDG